MGNLIKWNLWLFPFLHLPSNLSQPLFVSRTRSPNPNARDDEEIKLDSEEQDLGTNWLLENLKIWSTLSIFSLPPLVCTGEKKLLSKLKINPLFQNVKHIWWAAVQSFPGRWKQKQWWVALTWAIVSSFVERVAATCGGV